MTADIIRVTDDSTRVEIAEALSYLCNHAKRQPCVLGDDEHPSEWTRAHLKIDNLLTDWQAAPA